MQLQFYKVMPCQGDVFHCNSGALQFLAAKYNKGIQNHSKNL